jgi:formylglycine-generating enzyme required for sulfatase activity
LAKQQTKEPAKPAEAQQVAVVVPPVAPVGPSAGPCGSAVTVPSGTKCTPLTAVQERGLKRGDTFRECADCPEMVVVPAGSFTMGSPAGEKDRKDNEEPQHIVTIGKAFAVGKLHVTVEQFAVFARETGFNVEPQCDWHEKEGLRPVGCVSWDGAKAYAGWMAKKTGKPYRLLSEAEWEYAARGQTSPGAYPRFWFGDDEKDLCQYANFYRKAENGDALCDRGHANTSPAGHYGPNAFGLYDMAGNAEQWTTDCWHSNYNGAPDDGSAWTTGCQDIGHVTRGGSYLDYAEGVRAAARHSVPSREWTFNVGFWAFGGIGFRVARTLTP